MNAKDFPKTVFEQVLLYFYKPFLTHIKTLAVKYINLVTFDDYGRPQYNDWEKELEYFIRTVVLPPLSTKEIIAIWGAGFIHWDYNIIQSVYKNAFIKEFNLNAYFPEFTNVLTTNTKCFYIVDSVPQYILSETEMKYALTEDKRFFNNFINRLISDANLFLLGAFIKNPELLNRPQKNNQHEQRATT